jgi:hypothetical protein
VRSLAKVIKTGAAGMNSIRAIAGNTIAQAFRMKIALVTVLLLLVIVPLMGMLVSGDGTLKGKVQTFMSYSISLTGMLLIVMTIFVSVYTLSSELTGRQMTMVVSKPVGRYEVVLGKFIGVVVVDLILLIVFSLIIFGMTLCMVKFSDAPAEEVAEVNKEVFTSRVSMSDPIDKGLVRKLAMERYEKLAERGLIPEEVTKLQALQYLSSEEAGRLRSVPVGGSRVWKFDDVRLKDDEESIFIQFKYRTAVTPANQSVTGVWVVGDLRQEKYGPNEADTPIYRNIYTHSINTVHEVEVERAGELIAPDGHLEVAFSNPPYNNTTVFPEEVSILYETGSFGWNFVRVVLLTGSRLIFFAALGVSLATWLSFPTAILFCILVFFIGSFNGFITESLGVFSQAVNVVYNFTIIPIMWMFPQLDGEFNPSGYLVSGDFLSPIFLGRVYGVTVFLKAGILILAGILFFSFREIAKVIV